MGLLDDAIREHLDLKRRRGGDPGEIERAEREALGPVRRGPEPMAADEADATGVPYDAGGDEPYDDRDDERWEEDELAGEEHRADPEATALMPAQPRSEPLEAAFDEDEDEPFADEEPLGEETMVHPPPEPPHAAQAPDPVAAPRREPDDLLMDDELFADPPSRRGEPEAGDETVEYHVEDALAEDAAHRRPEHEDEDPLEETPEFLQDTPDHDRLWFEQRPPRDFDFDK